MLSIMAITREWQTDFVEEEIVGAVTHIFVNDPMREDRFLVKICFGTEYKLDRSNQDAA